MSNKMPEAEVSLLLAINIAKQVNVNSKISVSIDGAQIKTKDVVHFDVARFMQAHNWTKLDDSSKWQGLYKNENTIANIEIHSLPGVGDVVARIHNEKILIVEAKKGTIESSKSSSEYKLIREALGQLLTKEKLQPESVIAIAVPHNPKFEELAIRWRKAPMIKQLGIKIITVERTGKINGLWD